MYVLCREKDAEINREREGLEQVKRNLERQVREVEEEMDIQRQELSLGYEEAMRKREHEFRVQSDEMRGIVLSHELKVRNKRATNSLIAEMIKCNVYVNARKA